MSKCSVKVGVENYNGAKSAVACLPDAAVRDLAAMFDAFSDPTRLKLLSCLTQGELCVGDLAQLLGVSASAVSHQLRGLRALRLVRSRRDGKMIFYALDDDHVQALLDIGVAHLSENTTWEREQK
jgi:ArsR family transcriptional regulator, lead/cadmium/zinc/bismuth-responsive transcriptional repressor